MRGLRGPPVVAGLLLAALLAGCSDGGPGPAPAADLANVAAGPEAPGNLTSPAAPVADEVVSVSWDGNTGTYAYVRETTTGQGARQDPVAGENGFIVERPGMLLVAADLALTWQAATPSSQQLTFDLMVMGPNSTLVASVTGPTGIAIAQQGLALPLDAETVVHAYFYNPTVFAHQPPLLAGAAADQAAHVEGTLTFRAIPR